MERIDILIILDLLMYEQCILLHLFKSIFSHNCGFQFSVNWSCALLRSHLCLTTHIIFEGIINSIIIF